MSDNNSTIKIEDHLQDIVINLEEILQQLQESSLRVPIVPEVVTSPVINVEGVKPSMWEFTVTKRDTNGRLEKFTAKPIS
jgi:hypothetical protein